MSDLTVWAIDDGYGDSKCNADGKPFYISSFVSDFRPKPADTFNQQTNHKYKYVSVKYKGKHYIVGDAATKLDMNIKWIGGENKHNHPKFPVLFATCLGLMANKKQQHIDCLMMGLPIMKSSEIKQQREQWLKQITFGNHFLELSYNGSHYESKEITIRDVQITSQPFGSQCSLILDHTGEIVNKNIAKGFNVIVDIGARTLNILTVDALDQVDDLTIRTNDGMFSVYQHIGKYLEKELKTIIPDGKLPLIIQQKSFNRYDLTELINQSYQNHAYTIQSILETLFINSWGFVSHIIFTGGGSEVLRPYLTKIYPQSNVIFLDRFATVKGLRYYGIRKTKQKKKNIQVYVGR